MTAKEVIERLQNVDPSAEVLVWAQVSEDADIVNGVMTSHYGEHKDRPYVKGDWPDFPYGEHKEKAGKQVVIIGCYKGLDGKDSRDT